MTLDMLFIVTATFLGQIASNSLSLAPIGERWGYS